MVRRTGLDTVPAARAVAAKGPPSVIDDVPAWTGAIDGDDAPSFALYTPLHEQFRYIHRQSLLLAYMRTSLAFKETRSVAWERASNVDVYPAKVIGGPLKPISLAIPKAGISTKRSRSLATEAAFLAYSETDVEHDMMRIVRMLSSPAARRGRGWRGLLWWRHRPPVELQLVVVLNPRVRVWP